MLEFVPLLDGEGLQVEVDGGVCLVPERAFVEDRVARDVDSFRRGVVEAICFRPALVADEDDLLAAVVELGEVRAKALDVGDASEHFQKVHGGFLPIPRLVGGLPVEYGRRCPVEEVHGGVHRLPPEVSGHTTRAHDASRRPHDHLIPALYDAILLWRVRRRVMALDPFSCTVLTKLNRSELTTIVSAKHLQFLASLTLSMSLERHDRRRRIRLRAQKPEPHKTAHVINE